MKFETVALWACAGLVALLAPTGAAQQINACDRLFPDPDDPALTLQQVIDAAEDGDIICLRGAQDGGAPRTDLTEVYRVAGLRIAKDITLRGGWDEDNADYLPNRIVIEGLGAISPTCPGNVLRDASFELLANGQVGTRWSFQPTDDVSVVSYSELGPPSDLDPSKHGLKILKEGVGPYELLLEQDDVPFPNGTVELSLDLTAFDTASAGSASPTPGGSVSIAAYFVVPGISPLPLPNAIPVPISLAGLDSYSTPVNLPATASANAVGKLVVVIQIDGAQDTTAFVDNLCLRETSATPPTPAPTLRLEAPSSDDAIAVRLENLSVSGGTAAVLVEDFVALELNRCYLFGAPVGVQTANPANDSEVIAISSVFFGLDTAANLVGADATFFQCSFLANTNFGIVTGGSNTAARRNVIACLFSDGGNLLGTTPQGVRLAGNLVVAADGTLDPAPPCTGCGLTSTNGNPLNTVLSDTDLPTGVGSATLFDDLFLNEDFNGQLNDAADKQLFAGFGFTDLPEEVQAKLNNRVFLFDFEEDARGLSSMQIGADEVQPIGGTNWYWQDVRFEYSDGAQPNRGVGGQLPPAVGANRPLDITITLINREVDEDVAVFIVPELLLVTGGGGLVPDPEAVVLEYGIPWGAGAKGVKALDQFEGTYSDVFTTTYRATGTGINGLVDGLATIVLVVDGEIYGAGFNTTTVNPGVLARSTFIVDTTPPVLSDPRATGADLIVATNDGETAPPGFGPYPLQWPGVAAVPVSFGTVNDRFRDPQVFFNRRPVSGTGVLNPLDFTVAVPFRDDGPVTQDGTGVWTGIATAGFDSFSVPTGDATSVLYGAIGTDSALEALADGAARWTGPRPGDELLDAFASAGMADLGGGDFEMQWTVTNVTYRVTENTWRIEGSFVAKDRAGNQVASARPLRLWWLTSATAQVSSGPSGPVDAPVVAWNLARPLPVAGPEPAVPIVRFKLWRQRFAGVANSPWDAIDDWSPWTDRAVIDLNSASANATLRAILRDPALQGETIGMVLQGADEAGNAQDYGTFFDVADFSAADFLALNAAQPVAWAQWENSEGPAALDTRVQARFWHNRVALDNCAPINDTSSLTSIEPNLGEIDFGSNTRIPLPDSEVADRYRVEAAFDISVNNSDAAIEWELYEDGVRVAALVLPPGVNTVQFPNDLFNLFPAAVLAPFLNAPCGLDCAGGQDRLGDEGCASDQGGNYRRRDVTYTFVARAVDAATGIGDATPATISFTVYVDDTANDDQPIKEVSRGN